MYQALYRKYRPRTFSDVYGQEHVTQTLLHQLQAGRISHAYLFTGSRGTGKTTCAKLLAKAACCLHPRAGEPCNECEICKGIDDGSLLDVLEIDAASNNGVDDIRELREKAVYLPSVAKYRIYIIDEVHMLSPGAFNALLKTLEEPPEHVIFILATTEVHKLPATILSRCQRFDFHRIPPELLAKRVSYVCRQEGISIADPAAELIASLADGGMRDALSILDMCAGCDGELTEEAVAQICGIAGREYLLELTDHLQQKDAAAALTLIDRLHAASVDMLRLCEELISHLRDLMLTKTLRSTVGLVVCSSQERAALEEQAGRWRLDRILFALELLENTLNKMGRGNRRTLLEMAVVRLCDPTLQADLNGILARVGELEAAVRAGRAQTPVPATAPETQAVSPAEQVPSPTEPVPSPADGPSRQSEFQPADDTPPWPEEAPPEPKPLAREVPNAGPETAPAPAPASSAPAEESNFPQWRQVAERLFQKDRLWGSMAYDVQATLAGEVLTLHTDSAQFRELYQDENPARRELLKRTVAEVTGTAPEIRLAEDPDRQDPLDRFLQKANDLQLTLE